MFIRKPAELTYADVTPKSVYVNRRSFLQAMGIASAAAVGGSRIFELAAPSQTALAATEFRGLIKSPLSTTEKVNSFETSRTTITSTSLAQTNWTPRKTRRS